MAILLPPPIKIGLTTRFSLFLDLSLDNKMANETLNFIEESNLIIKDISFSVSAISLSQTLPQSPHLVYFNIVTKESKSFTVRLSTEGFKVVSHRLDSDEACSGEFPKTYETVYSLLETISASYVSSFGNALMMKLSGLENKPQDEPCDQLKE